MSLKSKILSIFGVSMSRPRVFKYNGGTVSLQGFKTEEADKIQRWMEETISGVSSCARGPVEQPTTVTNVEPVVETKPEPVIEPKYSEIALGLYYNLPEKMFKLVEIEFDPETKTSRFLSVKNAGEYKAFAINNFRIACVQRKLVS